ncbi:Panacea domain-containing protein [Arthrobacter sp. A2-55]|uniref:Panacea domain-containing protein n=1 Tax=Arthrobacter sp. A2-55 TaxID=2897337 RepID=UPI0021CD5A6C|nr:type II toxin-antitoxin system antitoxin SocA domain-containing protein [Arthrobacter sp. A2-55]MCU6480525.1 DUF4065 domain-containing protein [Arthrobacter sp. A2-55]
MSAALETEPTPQVLDAAACIIRRLLKLGPVDTVKVQRLLYYANAWSLVSAGNPLFEDEIRAWPQGPVVATLHPLMPGPLLFEELFVNNACALSPDERGCITWTVNTYGGLSGYRLSNLARRESPWLDAWSSAAPNDGRGAVITHRAMLGFYGIPQDQASKNPHI